MAKRAAKTKAAAPAIEPVEAPANAVAPVSAWQAMDTAPRLDAAGKPAPVLMFVPWSDTLPDNSKVPNNAKLVGWWSEYRMSWVSSPFKGEEVPIYPSRWQALPDDPEKVA